MSAHRVLLLEGPLSLAIDTGRLRIRGADRADVFVQPDDIAVLVVDHPAVVVTAAVLRSLAVARCIVLVTDDKHLPLAEAVPVPAPTRAGARLRQQLELEESPRSAELWRDIVQSRIRTQATVLRNLGLNGALNLERMVDRVEPGDNRNHEAQAARQYWKFLLPEGTRRSKQGATDGVNARLNYGYAIIRSMVARALVAAGLQPLIGMGHRSSENPLNLADDFIEPYRFVVEQHVLEILREDLDAAFDAQGRKAVAGCVAREVTLEGDNYRLPAAIERTVESFTRVLDGGRRSTLSLELPASIA